MKRICLISLPIIFGLLIFPGTSFASQVRTFSGTVTRVNGGQIVFKTNSAASYAAAAWDHTQLVRKYGAPMRLEEILPGDKIEVKGTLWEDNSITASYVRDMPLYTHTSTFSGKVSGLDPLTMNFSIQSKANGTQVVHTDNLTPFKKNGAGGSFKDVTVGYTATVQGAWERTNVSLFARQVALTYRLVSIDFTGELMMKDQSSFTVAGNGNVLYTVEAAGAKFTNKNGKAISLDQIYTGHILRVQGKHIAESIQVTATAVKDISLLK